MQEVKAFNEKRAEFTGGFRAYSLKNSAKKN